MIRLSEEEEKKLMFDSSNNHNFDRYKQILPYFGYDDESNRRIEDFLNGNYDDRSASTNEFLRLNSQLRAWFKISPTPETDSAFATYCSYLRNSYRMDELCYDDRTLYCKLYNYDNFRRNSFEHKGQTFKLTKYLLSQNILNQRSVDIINKTKIKQDYIYICVSRNPIDYLFCSTDQSYSSCESLKSDYSYYLGLGGLCLDPNRVLVFVSTGKVKKYAIKELEFKHYAYIQRTWGLLGYRTRDPYAECHENSKFLELFLIRHYPSNRVSDLRLLLQEALHLSVKDCSIDYYRYFQSAFKFEWPRFAGNGNPAHIYLDNIGFDFGLNYYTQARGRTGMFYYIEWNRGFENLQLDTVENGGYSAECCNCGESLSEDDIYEHNDRIYCEECYHEIFCECYSCGEIAKREYCANTRNGEYICENCIGEEWQTCENCGYAYHSDDIRYIKGADVWMCERCARMNYYECDDCNEKVDRVNTIETPDGGKDLCASCMENYTQCEDCNIWFSSGIGFKKEYNKYLCEECIEKRNEEECDQAA